MVEDNISVKIQQNILTKFYSKKEVDITNLCMQLSMLNRKKQDTNLYHKNT